MCVLLMCRMTDTHTLLCRLKQEGREGGRGEGEGGREGGGEGEEEGERGGGVESGREREPDGSETRKVWVEVTFDSLREISAYFQAGSGSLYSWFSRQLGLAN